MTRRSVLVTGAAGFVGSNLVSGFVEMGMDVVAVDMAFDDEGPDGELPRGSVTRIEGDLGEDLVGGLPSVDVVVHGAWITTDPEGLGIGPEEYVHRNLQPLRALLTWARSSEPGAFVFLSSSGVFAPGDAANELTDADEPTGTAPYAVAKREAEQLVAEASKAITVRLGYLFGPGERLRPTRTRRSLVADWISAAEQGSPLLVRSDDPRRDWTLVGDLAPALLRVVDGARADPPIHLGSPHRYRDSEVAALILERYPGSRVEEVRGPGSVKPPMKPSEIPALEGFVWTDLRAALDGLPGTGAAA